MVKGRAFIGRTPSRPRYGTQLDVNHSTKKCMDPYETELRGQRLIQVRLSSGRYATRQAPALPWMAKSSKEVRHGSYRYKLCSHVMSAVRYPDANSAKARY
jgi:hypothetical protein